jgi:hypothetical protein
MKPSGGTIIRATRALKGPERNYLLRRWGAYRAGQAAIAAALAALLLWAVYSEDPGLRFIFVLLAAPGLLGIKFLQDKAGIYGRDLRDNSVQSVIGAVGGLDLSPGLVPLHLGTRVYFVQAELLRRKRDGEPIMVEFLEHTGLAVAIDGRSNLLSLKQWLEVADQAART